MNKHGANRKIICDEQPQFYRYTCTIIVLPNDISGPAGSSVGEFAPKIYNQVKSQKERQHNN